jgi:hypothetical protein
LKKCRNYNDVCCHADDATVNGAFASLLQSSLDAESATILGEALSENAIVPLHDSSETETWRKEMLLIIYKKLGLHVTGDGTQSSRTIIGFCNAAREQPATLDALSATAQPDMPDDAATQLNVPCDAAATQPDVPCDAAATQPDVHGDAPTGQPNAPCNQEGDQALTSTDLAGQTSR